MCVVVGILDQWSLFVGISDRVLRVPAALSVVAAAVGAIIAGVIGPVYMLCGSVEVLEQEDGSNGCRILAIRMLVRFGIV